MENLGKEVLVAYNNYLMFEQAYLFLIISYIKEKLNMIDSAFLIQFNEIKTLLINTFCLI